MRVNGEATLHGPVETVYATLHDPAVLVRTIPGCGRLEQVGPDAYRMVLSAGVAAIKGTYTGDVLLTEQEAPNSFLLKASGSGAPGTVSAEVRIRLAGSNGATVLTYDADAVVGGPVGGVGQRILAGVAKKTANEFFAAVDDVLTGAAVEPGAPAVTGGPTAPAPGGVHVTVPRPGAGGSTSVFLRPRPPKRALPGGDFATGVAFGAAAALLGVLVGGFIARRPRG
ncbi:MAG: carbon monoxide dehydrogenase [Actinobacteria bacterium 13_2_20CM_2_71_6]|nr:MAG: carbon monoxide dehydrogenase [Actinobacteria bacterium 13_2_20CM_2_71_6]